MTSATLLKLRAELENPNNQDIPMESIKDLLGGYVDVLETEMTNGSSQPVQASYIGNAVSVDNGSFGNLTWDTLQSGTELLDRTDPANPLLLAPGTYAISIEAFGGSLTVGGAAALSLNQQVQDIQTSADPINGDWVVALTAVIVFGPDDIAVPINANIYNVDGVSARNFQLSTAILVKLA